MLFKGNKRGLEDKLQFTIWELLAGFTVLIVLMAAVSGIMTKNTYWKKYYTIDLSTMADIENVNQGDFVMNYQIKQTSSTISSQKHFEFELLADRINIYDYPKKERSIPVFFPYSKHPYIQQVQGLVSSDFIVLMKKDASFELKTYYSDSSQGCPALDTKFDIQYLKFNSISISAETKSYADAIKATLKQYGKTSAYNELTVLIYYEKPDASSSLTTNPPTPTPPTPTPPTPTPPAQNTQGGVTQQSKMVFYYSDDQNYLKSQKLACKFSDAFKAKDAVAEFAQYDGFLDANKDFSDFVANKNAKEYWIIIKTDDIKAFQTINANDFSDAVRGVIEAYYSQ